VAAYAAYLFKANILDFGEISKFVKNRKKDFGLLL